MTDKALPVNFQQNFYIFQKLNFLEQHEELWNIVILDYESLSGKQQDLSGILSCWFLLLIHYFHVIILVDPASHAPNTHGAKNCTVIRVKSQFLRNVNHISDHIVTQIMMCFSNGLFQKHRYRRAYYCLSEDADFPNGLNFMGYTGHEHVYCSVLRSVKDFLDLEYYFRFDVNDPAKMNVYRLLKNDFQRGEYGDNSGKLMFFVHGEAYFRKSITFLWKELKKFGNTHELPVSVTTAFPSVDYEEIQYYPHRTKPSHYRFSIYIKDVKEDNIMEVLDLLRLSHFDGTNWSLKLDKHTEEGRFGSAGDKNITTALYKICKYYIQLVLRSDNQKSYKTIEDEYMKKLIQEAKGRGLTIKVRYAKILFCGASGAGKTSFTHLLKNKKLETKQHSTGLTDLQHIMISEKASFEGTEWIDLNPYEEFLQLKLRMHHIKLLSQTEELSQQITDDGSPSSFTEAILNVNQEEPDVHQRGRIPDVPQQEVMSIRQGEDTEIEKRLYSKTPTLNTYKKPPEIWDILTLLDTGGQPQFINMLPAVNSSATITFVVLNMLGGIKHLEERVQVHHYDENGLKSYEPYPLNYTNKDLIKCLVGLLKDSIVKDIPLPDVFVSKKAVDNKPGLCFVGTHLDKVSPQDVDMISIKLEELVKQLEPNDNISIWNLGSLLFPVDNTIAGTEVCAKNSIADEIRCEIKKIIETKAVYEVPIAWIMLELEIRRKCNNYKEKKSFMPISEVELLYEKILPGKNVKSEVKAALRFHHMFGVLLYFHDVPGMNNYVISNPQWLFTNLTNLVCCSFDNKIVDHKDINNFKMKGILTNNLIQKLNADFLDGIKLEYFLELLKYLKIITPYPTNDSADYLMLIVLDSFHQEISHFVKDFPFLQLQGVELFMQLQSGTLPRGVFCCLVVQLIRQKSETWQLQISINGQRCIYENLVVFCTNFGDYIFLHDRVTYLEVQIRQKEPNTSIHCEVQKSLTQAIQDVCFCVNAAVKYGFYCNDCSKPIMKISNEHVNGQKPLPPGLLCDKHGCVKLTASHTIWFKASASLVITNDPMNVTTCSGGVAEISCYFTGAPDPFNTRPDWRIIRRNNDGHVISNKTVNAAIIRFNKTDGLAFRTQVLINNSVIVRLSIGPVDDTYNNTSYQCIFTISDTIIESDTAGTVTVIGILSSLVLTYASTLNEILVLWSPVDSDTVCGPVKYNITVMPSHGMIMMISDTVYNISGLHYNTNYTITVRATNNYTSGKPATLTVKTKPVPTPTVIVTALSTQTVGQSVTLQCEVITMRGITSRVDIVWSSDGIELERMNNVSSTTMNSSLVYTDYYTISQLSTTDDDRVIQCEGVINAKLLNTSIMASDSITLDLTDGNVSSNSDSNNIELIAGIAGGIIAVVVVMIIVIILWMVICCKNKDSTLKKEIFQSYPLVEGDNTHTNSACDKFEEQEYATVDDIKNQRIPVSESQYDKLSKKAESDTEHKTFAVVEHDAVGDSEKEASQEDQNSIIEYDDVLVENKVTRVNYAELDDLPTNKQIHGVDENATTRVYSQVV